MEESSVLSARQQAAAKILASPEQYKVCEGCGSIVLRKSAVCPNCNAYRFDLDLDSIRHQANMLAKREPLSVDQQDYL